MAGSLIQVGGTDGALRVKQDGIVVAGAGDPCCCAGCQGCAGTYRLRFSGVTLCLNQCCTGLLSTSLEPFSAMMPAAQDLDELIFDVPLTSSQPPPFPTCFWSLNQLPMVSPYDMLHELTLYNGFPCNSIQNGQRGFSLYINYQPINGSWRMNIELQYRTYRIPAAPVPLYVHANVFRAVNIDWNCRVETTVNNSLLACDCGPDPIYSYRIPAIGHGGQVTITPL